MLSPTGIPGFDEIFKGLPKAGLVILAGGPGVGKTIFSASYLYHGATRYQEPGLYVSLAESREEFYENLTVLGMDFKRLEAYGLFSFMELPTLMESSGMMFSRIMEEAEKLSAKRLVIDSMTALAQSVKSAEELRTFLHTLLLNFVKKGGCTAILIEEIPRGIETLGRGVEEFVASAVIELEHQIHNERSIRVIKIPKLRGGRLEKKQALFTLERGFKVFSYKPMKELKPVERYRPLPQPAKGFSTGMAYLNELLGGYPEGATIFFEMSPDIEHRETVPIFANVLADFIHKGKPAIIMPLTGFTSNELKTLLKLYGFSEDEYASLLRIFVNKELARECKLPYVLSFDPDNVAESIGITEEELRKESRYFPVKLINLDQIALAQEPSETLHLINHEIGKTKACGGLLVIVSRRLFEQLAEDVGSLADMHFKIERLLDVPVIYGLKPPTPILAMEIDYSKGYPQAILTPII